jgi:DNA replication and repair protein RecF
MTLGHFSCTHFRCLEAVQLEASPRYNLIHGANASGKTSLLEAIAYLGRGRSFRGAPLDRLIRHGATEFVLFGRVETGTRTASVGVRNGRAGLEISVDGDRNRGAADLAEALPLQIVDPEVHNLVAGGPELRRRYLDWIAFHVEQGYLAAWRRFRRALKQRNAALREDAAALPSWDHEFLEAALQVHAVRVRTLARTQAALLETGLRLLGSPLGFDYHAGWPAEESLGDALKASRQRDGQQGNTRPGPQHADLKLSHDERQARKRVSRGQQKLLACTLILAATEVVQAHLQRPLLLLLDDPAAELDGESLRRLMSEVERLGAQVIATALEPERALFPEPPATFHVEHGVLTPVS